MADGKETKTKVNANPEAGARQAAGKTSNPESVMTDSKQKMSGEAVTTVSPDVNKGKAVELASANTDGNPKKRTCNSWGIETPSCNK